MAIVLDNIVYSAPVINGPIPGGHGVITLGRGNNDDMMKEAKDLAIVLRAGALPAQLDFLEQRVVGPSLGQDSIKKGAMASLIGALAVFIFVGVYYRVSGLIAVFSLILNVLFVLAMLVGLEATLTLPGIAGIALTVGIAVDSNVVIYERIREELARGQTSERRGRGRIPKSVPHHHGRQRDQRGRGDRSADLRNGPDQGFRRDAADRYRDDAVYRRVRLQSDF